MWFSVLAACSREEPAGSGLREEASIAGCEGRALHFASLQYAEPGVPLEPWREEWGLWDEEERLVDSEIEDYGNLFVVFRATYDSWGNPLEEYLWQDGGWARLTTTKLDGEHALEQLYAYGTGPPDATEAYQTDTLSHLWSGGANVGAAWDVSSDGVVDVRISHDYGWESPERWASSSSEDYDLDGTADRRYGQATGAAYTLAEEWEDDPVGGELEALYVADVDEHGRTWSSERFSFGVLYESCTYVWDGLVRTGWTCEYGEGVATFRERTERIEGADGRPAEWRVYSEDLANPTEGDEVLTRRSEWIWICAPAG